VTRRRLLVSAKRSATERQRELSSPVTVTTVHKEAWETALRAAEGDVRRIVVISPTEIIVTNRRTS
jgi:hypothetical protein